MKVLVTGGAGFIGSHVVEFYAEKGYEVVVYDNFLRASLLKQSREASLHNWRYLKERFGERVRLVEGDIRDFEKLSKEVEDADLVVHTAAQVAVTTSLLDPKVDFEINALGTFNVLEAARKAKSNPTIIYCSTNKVYGDNVNKIPVEPRDSRYVYADPRYQQGIPEDYPVDLCEHTPYGCSKLAGELYVQDYARVYGLKTGVFRMSCIYGERQMGAEDQGWLAWFTIALLTGREITIYGDGKQVRDVLYVKDLIEAYDLFFRSELTHEVFNIGGGPHNTLSLLELLRLLEEITGLKAKVSFSDWRPGDQKVYISDISKIANKLGWRPKVHPKEGVVKLMNWIQENKHLFLT